MTEYKYKSIDVQAALERSQKQVDAKSEARHKVLLASHQKTRDLVTTQNAQTRVVLSHQHEQGRKEREELVTEVRSVKKEIRELREVFSASAQKSGNLSRGAVDDLAGLRLNLDERCKGHSGAGGEQCCRTVSTADSTNGDTLCSTVEFHKENVAPNAKTPKVQHLERQTRSLAKSCREKDQHNDGLVKELELERAEKEKLEREVRGDTRKEKIESTKPTRKTLSRRELEAEHAHKAGRKKGRAQSMLTKANKL